MNGIAPSPTVRSVSVTFHGVGIYLFRDAGKSLVGLSVTSTASEEYLRIDID